ncbi:MAG: 3-oxoacyl-ACP reductase [Acidimicrobiales bacterium]|nr:3-oxoacyl-ACP reductase [Acidimicrobiales bacterium]
MVDRLRGKVAVITGAGGGLGRAMSVSFAGEGASVVCQDLNGDAAHTTADAASAAGAPGTLPWTSDVTDSAAIDAMFDAGREQLGVVDVLVSNAGVAETPGDGMDKIQGLAGSQLVHMSDDAWRRMLDIHLSGAFYCARAMMRALLDAGRGGSMIFISSIAGTSGWGPPHYAAGKGGLLGLMRSIARTHGGLGVRANAICPGVIDTNMTRAIPPAMVDGLKMMTPLGQIGDPSDIASLAVYLAADESKFVTGQALSPNGGLVI